MYYYSVCSWKFGPGVEFVLYFGMEEYTLSNLRNMVELKGHKQTCILSSDLNYSLRTSLLLTWAA